MVGTYYFLEFTSKKNHHRLFFSKTQPFGHRAEGGMPLPTHEKTYALTLTAGGGIAAPLQLGTTPASTPTRSQGVRAPGGGRRAPGAGRAPGGSRKR